MLLFCCEGLARLVERGTDSDCYYVCCEGLGRAVERGTDPERYCVFVKDCSGQ